LPAEAMALVYGYLGSMLALALLVGVLGTVAFAQRMRIGVPALREMDEATADALVAEVLHRPATPTPLPVVEPSVEPQPAPLVTASDDDASIPDRFVAFGIDL